MTSLRLHVRLQRRIAIAIEWKMPALREKKNGKPPQRDGNYSLRGAPHMCIYSHGLVRRECLGARAFEY
eukprot:8415108-Pyramimonas_sp.AAC.1